MATSETLTLNLTTPAMLEANIKEEFETDANYLASTILQKFADRLWMENRNAEEYNLEQKTPYQTLEFNAPSFFDTARGSFLSTKKENIRTRKSVLEEAVKILKKLNWDISVKYDQEDAEETVNLITMKGLTQQEIADKVEAERKHRKEVLEQQKKVRDEEFAKMQKQAENLGYNVTFSKPATTRVTPRQLDLFQLMEALPF